MFWLTDRIRECISDAIRSGSDCCLCKHPFLDATPPCIDATCIFLDLSLSLHNAITLAYFGEHVLTVKSSRTISPSSCPQALIIGGSQRSMLNVNSYANGFRDFPCGIMDVLQVCTPQRLQRLHYLHFFVQALCAPCPICYLHSPPSRPVSFGFALVQLNPRHI